uniref:SGNH hydrolase-type esterase domain-containing protein n=1 Tax=Poecilia formosa TaxID=48698 RepID=A0A096M5V6_POEFO
MSRLLGNTSYAEKSILPSKYYFPPSFYDHSTPPKKNKQAAGTKTAPPTPLPRKKRPAQASKHSDAMGIPLKNRFSALQPEPEENSPSNINNEARPAHLPPKAPKDKATTRKTKCMPKVLIVGDEAGNGVSYVWNPKKTRVISSPGDTISDLLSLTNQPNFETLVVHVGANDLAKQKFEILKKDFNNLLNTMGKLKMKLFLSGPIPSGDEKHSRLDMINKWLISSVSSVTFIDNLWIYWQRFHLGRGGRNKHGIKLLTANLFHFINKDNNVTIASEEQAQGCLARMEPSMYQEQTIPKQADKTSTEDRATGSRPPFPLSFCSYTHSLHSQDTYQEMSSGPEFLKFTDGMNQQVCLGTSLLIANIADLTSFKPPYSDLPEDPALCVSEV